MASRMRQPERRLLVRAQPVLGSLLAAMGLLLLALQAGLPKVQMRDLGTGFVLAAGGLSLIHRTQRGRGLASYSLAAAALAGLAYWLTHR